MNKKVSAKDVAVKAGVSQSTVSRVLGKKGDNLIGESTREKVLKIANEMGYVPNPIAQALRGGKSYLLGLIVREIADPFFSKFIAQLCIHARENGYHIVLGHAGSDPLEAIEINNYLDMRHTDGVFLLGDLHGDEEILFDMLEQKNAVVALCRGASPKKIHTLNVDNKLGVRMIMDYLSGMGHTKFGFINGGWLGDIKERLDEYKRYVVDKKFLFNEDWVKTVNNTAEGGYKAAKEFVERGEIPTAVLASDDEVAIGAIRGFLEAGLNIPGDVSVTGFDNIGAGSYLTPSLTTIGQPVEEMCKEALSIMMNLVDEEDFAMDSLVIHSQPELIIRESTGPVPATKEGRDV